MNLSWSAAIQQRTSPQVRHREVGPKLTSLGLVYTEHRTGGLYIDEPKEITSFEFAFDYLVGAALSRKDSVRLIREAAASWR